MYMYYKTNTQNLLSFDQEKMRITENYHHKARTFCVVKKMLLQLDYFYNYIPVHISPS